MPRTSFENLLEAGAHFGHLKRKWNPNIAPYVFGEKNGIHIIDLNKTMIKLDEAANAMKQIAKSGRTILFVATKKQAKEIVSDCAKKVNMPYVTERWLGGMLTNFNTVRKSVKKMQSIEKMLGDGSIDNLTKKERLTLTRDKDKMEKVLGGIAQISRVPAALFLVDIGHEHIALAEAKRLNINTFGMVDTNCDPNKIDYAIPANDDATKSIAIIVNYITAAIAEGLAERLAEKDEDDHTDTEETAEARAARFENKLADGEDRNKRSKGGAPAKRRVPNAGPGGRRPAAGGGGPR